VQAPEGRGIFLNLSVEENLDLGAWTVSGRLGFSGAAGRAALAEELEKVFALFPRLKERRRQNAGTLSGGEQQMLAIGRSLMNRPELLLLDEPSLGLAPQMVEKIFDTIVRINREGLPVPLDGLVQISDLFVEDPQVVVGLHMKGIQLDRLLVRCKGLSVLALFLVEETHIEVVAILALDHRIDGARCRPLRWCGGKGICVHGMSRV
jgi:hypothetical protein